MTTPLPQPPPDRPAPTTPGPDATDSIIKAKMIAWLGGISMAVCLVIVGAPRVIHTCRGGGGRPEVITNIKQIGAILIEFDAEYGQFPDASTATAVKASTSTPLSFGNTSSNDLFKQCLAGGGGKSEKPFWAKTAISPKKPDEIFSSDSTALVKGECGFAYIAGLSVSDDPNTPVVMTSLLPGKLRFDPKAFDGKAVILLLDNTTRMLPIEKNGQVLIGGMDIFDPRQPFWKGKKPDVKWPE